MKKIIMATNNKCKILELKKLIKGYDILSQKEAGIDDLKVEENGDTFEENAILKAKSIKKYIKDDSYIIAEDSGICIETLGGYPGTKTKRAAQEELKKDVSDQERNKFILEKMKNNNNRDVVWQTVIALIEDNGNITTFYGQIKGEISQKALGYNGFGFDPIFYIEKEKKTLAQMSFEEKEKYSARKIAVDKLNEYLKNIKNN